MPSTLNDLLIFVPSLSRPPTAPVAAMRSEPARSTRLILVFNECTGVLLSFYKRIKLLTYEDSLFDGNRDYSMCSGRGGVHIGSSNCAVGISNLDLLVYIFVRVDWHIGKFFHKRT